MKSFIDWYKDVSGGEEPPKGNVSGEWFAKKGLPMIVECTCCGSTMVLFNSYVDEDDYVFCPSCAGVEED